MVAHRRALCVNTKEPRTKCIFLLTCLNRVLNLGPGEVLEREREGEEKHKELHTHAETHAQAQLCT